MRNKKVDKTTILKVKKELRKNGVSEPSIRKKVLSLTEEDPAIVGRRYADYIKQVVLNFAALFYNEEASRREELINSKVLNKQAKEYIKTLIELENKHYDPIFELSEEALKTQYKLIDGAASALVLFDLKFMHLIMNIGVNMNKPGFFENLENVVEKYNKIK